MFVFLCGGSRSLWEVQTSWGCLLDGYMSLRCAYEAETRGKWHLCVCARVAGKACADKTRKNKMLVHFCLLRLVCVCEREKERWIFVWFECLIRLCVCVIRFLCVSQILHVISVSVIKSDFVYSSKIIHVCHTCVTLTRSCFWESVLEKKRIKLQCFYFMSQLSERGDVCKKTNKKNSRIFSVFTDKNDTKHSFGNSPSRQHLVSFFQIKYS